MSFPRVQQGVMFDAGESYDGKPPPLPFFPKPYIQNQPRPQHQSSPPGKLRPKIKPRRIYYVISKNIAFGRSLGSSRAGIHPKSEILINSLLFGGFPGSSGPRFGRKVLIVCKRKAFSSDGLRASPTKDPAKKQHVPKKRPLQEVSGQFQTRIWPKRSDLS